MLLRPAWRLSHIERETEEGRRGGEGGAVLGHNASALKPVCNVPLTQVFKLSRFLADPTGLLYDSTKRHFRKSCNSVGGSKLQT